MSRLSPMSMVTAAAALSLLLAACGGAGNGDGPGGPTQPKLTGSYRFVQLRAFDQDVVATTGRVVAGEDLLQPQDLYAYEEGSVIGPVGDFPVPYEIEPDGGFMFIDPDFTGRASSDGAVAAASTKSEALGPRLALFVRHKLDTTLADLEGTWLVMSYGRAGGMWEQVSGAGVQQVDAMGDVDQLWSTSNYDGEIDPLPTVSAAVSFHVEPDGSVTLRFGGDVLMRGDVSTDGNLVVLAGNELNGVANVRVMMRSSGGEHTLSGTYDLSAFHAGFGGPYTRWGLWSVDDDSTFVETVSSLAGGPLDIEQEHGFGFAGNLWAQTSGGMPRRLFGAVGPKGDYAFFMGSVLPGHRPQLGVVIR